MSAALLKTGILKIAIRAITLIRIDEDMLRSPSAHESDLLAH